MSSGDVLLVSEDLDFPSYQAANDAPAAVDICAFHDDGVLYLCVLDGGVVSDACLGTDVGVGPMVQCSPMMAGALMVVRLWMMVPLPMATLFVMVAVSSMVPWL